MYDGQIQNTGVRSNQKGKHTAIAGIDYTTPHVDSDSIDNLIQVQFGYKEIYDLTENKIEKYLYLRNDFSCLESNCNCFFLRFILHG